MSATVVVDLGYGDAGKGTTVDRLCSPSSEGEQPALVVRFNGGAQAAHNAVLPDGRHHTFSQFGSGTLHGVPTLLSRFVAVDPIRAIMEADHLERIGVDRPFRLLALDGSCRIMTPAHQFVQRNSATDGSCGTGFGVCVNTPDEFAIHARDLLAPAAWLRLKLRALYDHLGYKAEEVDSIVALFKSWAEEVSITYDLDYLSTKVMDNPVAPIIFEGAQGVLLDQDLGFNPYTTWSTCTTAQADYLIDLVDIGVVNRLGVVRTYTTRHGLGPFVSEAAHLSLDELERHNNDNEWQGPWRVGHFDAVSHLYAADKAGALDGLVVTHLDVPTTKYCAGWNAGHGLTLHALTQADPHTAQRMAEYRPVLRDWQSGSRDRADEIGQLLGLPVHMESWGPTWRDKIERVRV